MAQTLAFKVNGTSPDKPHRIELGVTVRCEITVTLRAATGAATRCVFVLAPGGGFDVIKASSDDDVGVLVRFLDGDYTGPMEVKGLSPL